MSKLQYQECYYETDKEIITIDKIREAYFNNYSIAKAKYEDKIYCEECKNAKLAFIPRAKTPYLKSQDLGTHSKGCSYKHRRADKKQLEKLFNDKLNLDKLQRRLEGCLDKLFCNITDNKMEDAFIIDENNEKDNNLSSDKNVSQGKKSYIPRALITRNLKDKDFDTLKIFYGVVKIKFVEKTESHQAFYKLISPDNNKPILCNIFLTDKVVSYLDEETINNQGDLYQIAFFGKMKKGKQSNFKNFNLIDSRYMKIRKI